MLDPITFFVSQFRDLLPEKPEPLRSFLPRPYRNAAVRFSGSSIHAFEERRALVEEAGLNVFSFPARKIAGCDLLTDSGTTTMTLEQWAAMVMGDESYGSNEGYFEVKEQIPITFGPEWEQRDELRENFFIFHQGRSAEHNFFNLFAGELRKSLPSDIKGLSNELPPDLKTRIESRIKGMRRPYFIIPSNSHFDTTEGNIEDSRLIPLNLPSPEHLEKNRDFPFRGNIDLSALETLLDTVGERVPLVYLTITNNTGGGQPVSMENIRRVRELTDKHDIPLFFDACRFAENAWFIQQNEPGYEDMPIPKIVYEMFHHVDGFHISFKKDGLVNIGGGMAFKDDGRFTQKYPDFWMKMIDRQILTEGHPTYGGLAGRDLKALVEGLRLVTSQEYLDYRISQVKRFGAKLESYDIPIVRPTGGHAVYIDLDRFFAGTETDDEDLKGIAFTALMLVAGHRLVELGLYAFGKLKDGKEIPPNPRVNFIRASVPRLAYEDQDLFSVAEAVRVLNDYKDRIPAVEVVYGRDLFLRHFKSRFRFKL
ncbi:MAG: tryptophanase [Candidatus Latescibacterota bacterium]|nr:MAG: tryptophanase [Candidatus Latescibacterota bacterium]